MFACSRDLKYGFLRRNFLWPETIRSCDRNARLSLFTVSSILYVCVSIANPSFCSPALITLFVPTQEVQGANIFDIVESGSYDRLRRLLEENLGSVSKEAIASALRHQGLTFEDLLARSEKAKEQGDAQFFSTSGEAPRLPGSVPSRRAKAGSAVSTVSGTMGGVSKGGSGGSGGGASFRRGKSLNGSGSTGTAEVDGSTDDWESEVTSSSAHDSGGNGILTGGDADGLSPGRKSKNLPPLGPASISSGRGGAPKAASGSMTVKTESDSGAGRAAERSGHSLSALSAAAAALSPIECKEVKMADTDRIYRVSSESSGDGSIASSQGVVSVDRDLQSKINAFTNSQKVRKLYHVELSVNAASILRGMYRKEAFSCWLSYSSRLKSCCKPSTDMVLRS